MNENPTLPLETPPQPPSGRPKRPTRHDPPIVLAAARNLISAMRKRGVLEVADGKDDDMAADIAKCARYDSDGYRIAKALESNCYWYCNFQIAEALDDFSGHVDKEISHAEKEWAAGNGVAPPFSIGTRVRISSTERGVIDSIYEYGAAKYCIAVDGGLPNQRRIINFEDVVEEGTP